MYDIVEYKRKVWIVLHIFKSFASLFSSVTEKLLKYSIALRLNLPKLKLFSHLHDINIKQITIFRPSLSRLNNISSWVIMYVFSSSLILISKYVDALTPNLSSPSGKPHINLINMLPQGGFKCYIILNWIKSFHIYHVFYMGI